MLLTFKAAKDSQELADVAAACPQSGPFMSLLNQATRKLMVRGNFFGTVRKIRLCVYDNCITFPRYVGTILALNVGGNRSEMTNFWWQFLPIGNMGMDAWSPILSANRNGLCWGNVVTENDGTSPVFNNIPCGTQNYIRAYPSVHADVGKTITIFGIDGNGQEIYTTYPDGTYQPGVVLKLALAYAVTPMLIRKITRVVKDKTVGIVRLFQFDPINNVQLDCATYDPSETSPDYAHVKIRGAPSSVFNVCSGQSQCCSKTVDALIKLEFIPVQNDNDLVLIDNLDALQAMMLSIRNKTAGKSQLAGTLELDAIRELNYSLRDKFPLQQFECSFNPYGTAKLERVGIGMI